MKNIAILGVILTLSVTAAAFSATEANVFVCKGAQISATMSTTSKTGAPTLALSGIKPNQVTTLSDVSLHNTGMGQVVTGTDNSLPDAGLTYTLIAPHVLVNGHMDNVSAMLVKSANPGKLPPEVRNAPRVVEATTYIPVVCTASKAEF